MGDVTEKTSMFTYVRRAVASAFVLGFIVTTILMLLSGGIFARAGKGTHNLTFGPFTFFHISKENLEGGGSTVELAPGFGVMVLLVIFPALAGLTAYLVKKRKKTDLRQARGK